MSSTRSRCWRAIRTLRSITCCSRRMRPITRRTGSSAPCSCFWTISSGTAKANRCATWWISGAGIRYYYPSASSRAATNCGAGAPPAAASQAASFAVSLWPAAMCYTKGPLRTLPEPRLSGILREWKCTSPPSSKRNLRRSPLKPGPYPSGWWPTLLPAISTKKPVSLPPWRKESPRLSAASLSKKKKLTPALKPCSSPNARSLDRSSRGRSGEHQELSSTALPAFCGTDHPDDLTAYPFPENLTQPGQTRHRAGTRELALTPLPYVVVYVAKTEAVEILHIHHGAQDWR